MDHGFVEAKADKLVGSKLYLDFPSVGATENIMMAAVLAEGTTIIENAAEEPEIVDLANFLNEMGADVKGAGTNTIRIKGVKELKGTELAEKLYNNGDWISLEEYFGITSEYPD